MYQLHFQEGRKKRRASHEDSYPPHKWSRIGEHGAFPKVEEPEQAVAEERPWSRGSEPLATTPSTARALDLPQNIVTALDEARHQQKEDANGSIAQKIKELREMEEVFSPKIDKRRRTNEGSTVPPNVSLATTDKDWSVAAFVERCLTGSDDLTMDTPAVSPAIAPFEMGLDVELTSHLVADLHWHSSHPFDLTPPYGNSPESQVVEPRY